MSEIPDEYCYYQMSGGKLSYSAWCKKQSLPRVEDILIQTLIIIFGGTLLLGLSLIIIQCVFGKIS